MRRYVAFLHPDSTGGYGVSFPDFPGCISAGDDMAEAIDQAAQALRLHVEGMIEDGVALPGPRSVDQLRRDPDRAAWFEGAVIALVPLLPPRHGSVRLNVSLDRNLVREIDAAAKELGLNRSAFLADGAQRLLEDAAMAGRRRRRGKVTHKGGRILPEADSRRQDGALAGRPAAKRPRRA